MLLNLMAEIGLQGKLLSSPSVTVMSTVVLILLFFPFVSAERSLKHDFSSKRNGTSQVGYHHVWPEMKFGWRIIVGSVFGFFGAASGSVGGLGGGAIFIPMLTLAIGFDAKSSIAISKCMIAGTAVATVFYNLKLRHPTLGLPLIDYDLALLLQPMLVLGIGIGVSINVIFADWMVKVLLIILFFGTSARAFLKGAKTWKKETIIKKEAAIRLASNGNGYEQVESEPLPGSPINGTQMESKDFKASKVSIIENVYWKELIILIAVWGIILALEIAKNKRTTCSTAYWVLDLLQIPVTVGASAYKAISLYKGWRVIAFDGKTVKAWRVHQLVFYCFCGILAGIVAGLVGLGGGFILGPLFLEMGILPQVSSATANFIMMFSSSLSVVEYYLLKRFPVPYALYFVAVATIAAIAGQHVMSRIISILGRASLITFILAFENFLSAFSVGGVGISEMIKKIEKKEYMGFDNLCAY